MNVMGLACTYSTVIKAIVTTDIVFNIAKDFWADVIEVLTGGIPTRLMCYVCKSI